MKYYVTGALTVNDDSWAAEYIPTVTALVAKHGGTYLARTHDVDRLEGDGPAPSVAVIVEFPSKEAAEGFYNDPEYQPHRKARMAGASGSIFLIAGDDHAGG